MNDVHEVRTVLSLDVGLDCRLDRLGRTDAELCLAELHPHLWQVNLARVLDAAVEIFKGLENNLHCVHVEVKLLEDSKRFFVQLITRSNFTNLRAVERIESVDVIHDARRIRLDSGEDEQVLQVGIVAERTVLQHDLLQKFDEFVRHLSSHERLHGD